MAEQDTKVILRSPRGIPLDCGCIVDWNERAASLTYCSTHKAALEMIKALDTAARRIEALLIGKNNSGHPWVTEARKAIPTARGEMRTE